MCAKIHAAAGASAAECCPGVVGGRRGRRRPDWRREAAELREFGFPGVPCPSGLEEMVVAAPPRSPNSHWQEYYARWLYIYWCYY